MIFTPRKSEQGRTSMLSTERTGVRPFVFERDFPPGLFFAVLRQRFADCQTPESVV